VAAKILEREGLDRAVDDDSGVVDDGVEPLRKPASRAASWSESVTSSSTGTSSPVSASRFSASPSASLRTPA
jgi:hypothetical protein